MKIAVIATVWFPLSHADVIVSRWLEPFPSDAEYGWQSSQSKIASVYLDQMPDNDVGSDICKQAAVPIFPTIHAALTMGGDMLAVDAIILIGEHGDYPTNEYGQKLYPRREMFDQIVSVFRASGRSVPVFNDKHLSWSFDQSREMLAIAEEMKFPLYAGSSIPHCRMAPEAPVRKQEKIVEAVALFGGHEEHYGFHIVELVQSLIEKRANGESGISRVRTLKGREVLLAFERKELPADLVMKALACIGFPASDHALPFILKRTENLLLYQVEHSDGLVVTYLRLQKWVGEWVAAVRTEEDVIRSCRVDAGGAFDFFGNFARLDSLVNEFFETGKPPTPILRTHLATGALEDLLHALREGPSWKDTPRLKISYC